MKRERAFLTSRLGRRIFLLFVSCALIPILILAFFSFTRVTRQLQRQAELQLQAEAKAAAMSILERLSLAASSLQHLTMGMRAIETWPATVPVLPETEVPLFAAVAIGTDASAYGVLCGNFDDWPDLPPAQRDHVARGGTALASHAHPGEEIRLDLVQRLPTTGTNTILVVGQLRAPYLFTASTLR